jgi:general L-amino acid transport system substrate-binding protein
MLRTFRGGLLIGLAVAIAIAAAAITYERYDTKTLKRTLKRGEVLCGVNKGLPGFSIPDDKGDWTGFDVDFCRAIAAAIFDDPKKIKFLPLDASERFKELQSRKVDILSRNTTWSMSRDFTVYFPAVAYYDGQGSWCRLAQHRFSARPSRQNLRAGEQRRCSASALLPRQQHHGDGVSSWKSAQTYRSGKCDTFTMSQLYASG